MKNHLNCGKKLMSVELVHHSCYKLSVCNALRVSGKYHSKTQQNDFK